MNQYELLKEKFSQLKKQLQKLTSLNLDTYQEEFCRNLLTEADHFETFLVDNFVDFEQICDNLPDAIYVADKEGTTVYVNDM